MSIGAQGQGRELPQDGRALTVGWCVTSLSANIASIRYRALLPAVALEAAGHRCHFFTQAHPVDLAQLDVLVIVKEFNIDVGRLAQRAHDLGIPVYFDLCDNIFVQGYGQAAAQLPSTVLQMMSRYVRAIVVTTTPLADIVAQHLPGVAVMVIADGLMEPAQARVLEARMARARRERMPTLVSRIRARVGRLRQRARTFVAMSLRGMLRQLLKRWKNLFTLGFYGRKVNGLRQRLLRRASPAPVRPAPAAHHPTAAVAPEAPRANAARLLWYGNHGADYAAFGISDLVLIQAALEAVAREHPVELVVVSNHREKYQALIQPMAVPSRYVEWSSQAVEQELARATLVLVPNSLDPFSVCKSANRTAQALLHGVPVVATATPSLAVLDTGVFTGDTLAGLRRYLGSAEAARDDVALGQALARQYFAPAVIGQAWAQLMAAGTARAATSAPAKAPDLVVAMNLMQDVAMLLPVMTLAKQRGLNVEAWCSSSLLRQLPTLLHNLDALAITVVLALEAEASTLPVLRPGTGAFLTASETNLRPHSFTRTLTERANAAGIPTATLQHGFENVGLTYSDELHAVQNVNFASQKIYLWGAPGTLHADVPQATRAKCITAGCTKSVAAEHVDFSKLVAPERAVVGVFENLHWHRYSDDYRAFFLDGVRLLAGAFPALLFVLKPHPAGLWLTQRFQGERPVADNLIVAGADCPEWAQFTTEQLLGRMRAVITTPSTVALDAARCGLPVAIVAQTLALDAYEPLVQLRDLAHWQSFVTTALAGPGSDLRSARFVAKAIVDGPAAATLLDDVLA